MKWLMMAVVCGVGLLTNAVHGATAAPTMKMASEPKACDKANPLTANIEFLAAGPECSLKDAAAAALYFEAAKEGWAEGYFELGWCLLYGKGVVQNLDAAFQFFKRAVRLNFIEAWRAMYLCYHNGWGVKRNPEKGYEWYRCYRDAVKKGKERGLVCPKKAQDDMSVDYECVSKFTDASSTFPE